MKPLTLTVQALGPYAGEQSFDFAELKGRSFFLIHGPTGAGKTSILDAMCFALFGQASGAGRQPRQMRSDHADSGTPTKVVFEFAIGADHYRVERWPEQERPKMRGSPGMTLQEPKATLWVKTNAAAGEDEAPPAPVTGWQRVNEAVERLMGFQADQFRQVVMLPQGQFQQLLVAKSDERQKILENLFDVGVFGRIEQALKDAAKAAEREAADARRVQDEILRTLGAASADELAQKRQGVEAELATVRAAAAGLRAARAEAHDRLTAARRVAEKLAERDGAGRAVRELDGQREDMAAREAAHAGAVKAAALAEAEAVLLEKRKAAADSTRRLAAARAAAQQAEAGRRKADEALVAQVAAEPKREAARQEADRLAALEGKVLLLAVAQAQVRSAAETAARQAADRAAAEASLRRAREAIAGAEQASRQLHDAYCQLAAYQAAARDADKAMKDRQRLEQARKDLADADAEAAKGREKVGTYHQQLAAAKSILKDLESTWQRGQAAVLAAKLADGSPCPVCGSAHHPAPAHADRPPPTEAALDHHRQSVEGMEFALADLRDEAADVDKDASELRARVAGYEEALGGRAEADVSLLEQAARTAQTDLARAEAAGLELSSAGRRLEQAKQQEVTAAARLAGAEAAVATANNDLGAARAVAAERETGVPEALRDGTALASALGAARRTARAMAEAFEAARTGATAAEVALAQATATLAAADEAAAAAGRDAEAQAGLFARRVADAGFADEEAFRVARLLPAHVERLERVLSQYRVDVRAAKLRLERAAAAAEGLEAPDLAALQAAAKRGEDELEANVRQEETLAQRMRHADDALARLRQIDAGQKGLDARYRTVGQIAEVAGGKNAYRMTFQRYVLGVFLDEVLQAASQRLKIMSRGRFLLHRVRDPVTGRSAGGLDLEVQDEWTGTTRPVSTLSGGESFLASLALALGLADVVQAHAGGIRLQTIFVDEGFGSLDPEALDLAIRALQDLQHGGRLVGIISHVTELKEWVDARLEVRPGRRGSTARFVVP